MKKILFLCLLIYFSNANEINNSLNNNHNSVITIVKEVLGKDTQEHIIKKIVYELSSYLSKIDTKLLKNKQIIMNLSSTIKESVKTNQSLTLLLVKREQQRAVDLLEIEQLKKEQIKSTDVDFKVMIEEAEKALNNYNSKKYQKVLASYRENKKHKELIKNIATTHYLSAKNYAGDFYFDKAKKEINKAVALDDTNGDYAGWYGLILFNLAEYGDALEYLEKSLKIRVAIGDKSGEGATLNNIATIYQARGDLTKALEYLE